MKRKVQHKSIRILIFITTLCLLSMAAFSVVKAVKEERQQALEEEYRLRLEQERLVEEEIKALKQQKSEALRMHIEEQVLIAQEEKRLKEEEAKLKAEAEAAAKAKAEAEAKKKAEAEDSQVTIESDQALPANEDLQSTELTLEERVKEYLGSDIRKFGFVYYDLTTGEKIAINENKVFTAASTFKVGMNLVAYQAVRSGSLSLEQGILYNSSRDYEGGSGILQNQIDTTLKEPVALQRLLDLSITHSDNIATLMVCRTLGGARVTRQKTNELVGLSCETSSNKTTPEIQFRLLKLLYENRGDHYYARLLNSMKNTIYKDRLAKYIPSSLIAHKIGNYDTAVNDIGIVFTDKPYIIITYSEGLNGAYEKIALISEMVYNAQLEK